MMKKPLLLALLFTTAFVATSQARARIRIPVGQCQKIKTVLELPDTEAYRTSEDRKIDLGYMYTVYQIAYIPVWTVDEGQLVGFSEEEPDSYYELDDTILEQISNDTGVADLDRLKAMPFWDAWGGKLIALIVLAVIGYGIYSSYFGKKDEDED